MRWGYEEKLRAEKDRDEMIRVRVTRRDDGLWYTLENVKFAEFQYSEASIEGLLDDDRQLLQIESPGDRGRCGYPYIVVGKSVFDTVISVRSRISVCLAWFSQVFW